MKKCPHCGVPPQQTDQYGCDDGGHDVCTNCGAVLGDTKFVSDSFDSPIENSSGSRTFCRNLPDQYANKNFSYQIPPGKKSSITKVKYLCSFFGLNAQMIKCALDLLDQMYLRPEFIKRSISKKEILAGSCVYIVCRQRDWPITLSYVSSALSCEPCKLLATVKDILKLTNITISAAPIQEQVEKVCHSGGLGQDVSSLVLQLMPLCQKAWITVGRKPEIVIQAISYMAWQSLESPISIKQFFQKFGKGWNLTRSLYERVNEIKEMLVIFAGRLPWIEPGVVTVNNAVKHIADVVRYQKSLAADFRRNLKAAESVESCDINKERAVCQCGALTTTNYALPNSIVLKPLDHQCDKIEDCDPCRGSRPALAALQPPIDRVQMMPRAFTHGRQRDKQSAMMLQKQQEAESQLAVTIVGRNLDCEDLNDEDLDATELHLYVRSTEESLLLSSSQPAYFANMTVSPLKPSSTQQATKRKSSNLNPEFRPSDSKYFLTTQVKEDNSPKTPIKHEYGLNSVCEPKCSLPNECVVKAVDIEEYFCKKESNKSIEGGVKLTSTEDNVDGDDCDDEDDEPEGDGHFSVVDFYASQCKDEDEECYSD